MELNLRIRELRKARGMTLKTLAGRVGISIPHLSEVERGKKNLNNHLIARMAEALSVEPEELISGQNRADLARLLAAWSALLPQDRARLEAFAEALAASRPNTPQD